MLSTDGVCFALDENGQLIVPLRRISGVAAVLQGIQCRLRMFKEEWFLDLDGGGAAIPWLENENRPNEDYILGATFNSEKARFYIRRAILDTPATSPSSLTIDLDWDSATRELDITYSVMAVFDDIPQGLPITNETVTLEF